MYDALCQKCDNRSHFFLLFFFYIYTLFFFLRGSCLVSFCEKATLVLVLKNKINKTYTHSLSHSSPYRQANSQHRTSKKLFTQQTKILLFLLLIISLTQHNHLYLHFDTRSQNNKTQATMSDFVLFFFVRDIHYSHYSSIEYDSTPTTTTKYVLTLNYI